LIKELKPYLVGWRGYFASADPQVLTNLEAWIRRRLRLYLWRQWRTGKTASKNYAIVRAEVQCGGAAGSPTAWRMSGTVDPTGAAQRYFDSLVSPTLRAAKLNSVEPPRYGPYAGVWEGGARGIPYPIKRRSRRCFSKFPSAEAVKGGPSSDELTAGAPDARERSAQG